ncbi:MAG: D-arabinono-1,4-lactone oxidase [Bacteroidota bacterium]
MASHHKRNWAGNVRMQPSEIIYPASEAEIQVFVERAANDGQKIRLIGSGHSFTQLCKTDQILVCLDNFQGLLSVNRDKCQVTVKAGTKLKLLGELLFKEGLAMENLGDIDAQSIAGTISTGTHGTGQDFGTISTQLIGLKFVNGKGEVVSCSLSEHPDIFKAAQVSLGALGIITEVSLQCVPSYKLLIQNRKEKLSDVLSTIRERNEGNRNFEYYWFPHTQTAWTKTTNVAEDGEPDKDNYLNYLSELILENYTFKIFCEYARLFPSQSKRISKLVAQFVPSVDKLSLSHRVYATKRLVKFTEMEYNIPAEAYDDAIKDIMKRVNSGDFAVHFPIENRWVKGDDIYMSPANGRDSAYVACHMYNKKDSSYYFRELEAIFRSYGGRPHWGKMNTLRREEVEELYPDFPKFRRIQASQDPHRLFVNPYLEQLLG